MNEVVTAKLVVYGPLGILALVGLTAAVWMFRLVISERKAHAEEVKALNEVNRNLNEENKKALVAWEERYIAKAETWMQQYHELAKSMNAVLESFTKRRNNQDR
jgi:hypothetical protein